MTVPASSDADHVMIVQHLKDAFAFQRVDRPERGLEP